MPDLDIVDLLDELISIELRSKLRVGARPSAPIEWVLGLSLYQKICGGFERMSSRSMERSKFS